MTEKQKKPPRVRAGTRGHVNTILDSLAEKYKENNPGQDCRWVYAPEDRQDYSKVLQRRVVGYKPVSPDELGDDGTAELFTNSKGVIRVGDLILMGIEGEQRQELLSEAVTDAKEEAARVKKQFYDQVEQVTVRTSSGEVHRGVPVGDISVSEEEFELKLPEEKEG